MESELQSKTVWESKGSRAPGTFKEEVKWELILRRVV